MSTIDDNFYARGTSAMDTSAGILRGRPHGGLAILWRKDLQGCKVLDMEDNRLMCLELSTDNKSLILINVYLPCDSVDNTDDFLFYLAKINSFIVNHHSPYACVIGDFNANMKEGCQSHFEEELKKFCVSENFTIADKLLCDNDTFTFFSEAHSSVSWLDHVILLQTILCML